MGTRADFYVGKGKEAEWLGSIAWDGDEVGNQILECTSSEAFRHAVQCFLESRDDATFPKNGWPWPWDDSKLTDRSYWHFDGRTFEDVGYENHYYVQRSEARPDEDNDETAYQAWLDTHEEIDFPDMSAKKNVTFGERSGLIMVSR